MNGIAWFLLLLMMGGCQVGPDYRPPAPRLPERYSGGWPPSPQPSSEERGRLAVWWKGFNDPALDALIARAVEANLDLRLAEARIRETRAARRILEGKFLPTGNLGTRYQRSERSENINTPPGVPRETSLYEAGFDALWEIDLFGGTRREVEAAHAEIEAAEEALRDIQVSLIAEVARNYIDLRSAQQGLATARALAHREQEALALAEVRRVAGLSSGLDVARLSAETRTTESEAPRFEAAIQQALHRLDVLLNQPSGNVLGQIETLAPIPEHADSMALGLPSDLLRQRPDIRRAERELAAATARIGVAVADLFPRFSLTGALGLSGSTSGDLMDHASQFWAIGPTVRWPILALRQIRANIQVQDARQEQALVRYEKRVLLALEEVENALASLASERARLSTLSEAAVARQTVVEMTEARHQAGLADFSDVLKAEGAHLAAAWERSQARARVAEAVVVLYKALGGGDTTRVK